MKKLIIGAVALVLAAASPALAEKHDQRGGAHPGASAPRMGGGMPRMNGPAQSRPGMQAPMARERMRTPTFRERATNGVRERSTIHVRERAMPERNRIIDSRHRGRETIGRHASPKFTRYHHIRRAPRRFHAGIYHRPHGWFRHHWRLGERLPRGWFARNYWIADWGLYGLWAPYDGLTWVRVGPDAFLIDPYTGEVVSIEYDVFW